MIKVVRPKTMNISADKPWSTTMRVALVVLSALGVLVFVGSSLAAIHMMHSDGTVEASFIVGAIAGGVWSVFAFLLLRHPEWKRYLLEKL